MSNDRELTVKFRYTRREYLAAFRQHYSRTLHIVPDIIFGALSLIAGLAFWATGGDRSAAFGLTIVGTLLLCLIFYALVIQPGKRYAEDKKLQQDYTLVFSEEGIHFITETIDSRLKWAVYTSLTEYGSGYVLSHGKHAFTVLPRRVFKTVEDEVAFKEMAYGHIRKDKNEGKNRK